MRGLPDDSGHVGERAVGDRDADFGVWPAELKRVLHQVEQDFLVDGPVSFDFVGNVIGDPQTHRQSLLLRLQVVRLDELLQQLGDGRVQALEAENQLLHLVFDGRHLRAQHEFHELGRAEQHLDQLTAFAEFVAGKGEHLRPIDDAVEGRHHLVAQSSCELL